MKKTALLFLLFTAGVTAFFSCGEKKQKNPDQPAAGTKEQIPVVKDFVSEVGKFSIVFKTPPHEQARKVRTILNTDVTMYAFISEDEKVENKSYMVAYCDYPESVMTGADVRELLKDFKHGVVRKLDGTLTSDIPGKFQGYASVDFAASGPQLHTAYKMVMAGNRLYQVSILQQTEPVTQQDIDGFIGSFKISGE